MTITQRLMRREPSASTSQSLRGDAQLYIWGICLGGLFVLLLSFPLPSGDWLGVGAFLVFGGISQLLPIRFYKNASVSMSMAVALGAIVAYGVPVAVLVNLACGVVHYWTQVYVRKRPFYRSAFTTSTLMLAAWLSGHMYELVGGRVGPGSDTFLSLFPLLIASMVYYAINTLLVTGAIAFEQHGSFWTLLEANYQWLTVNIVALTPIGFGIAYIYLKVGVAGLVLFLLPILTAWYSFRLYAETTEDVRKANEELVQANQRVQQSYQELAVANEHVHKANEELKEANERLNIMYEASRSLVGALHVDDTLDRILIATRLLGFPAAFVAGPVPDYGLKIPHWHSNHPMYGPVGPAEKDHIAGVAVQPVIDSLGSQAWFLAGQVQVVTLVEPESTGGQNPAAGPGPNLKTLTCVPLFVYRDSRWILGVGSADAPSNMEMKELLLFRSMAENALEVALTHAQAERDARIDALTGLYNHRYFQEALQHELKQAGARAERSSLLMIDIDKFKELNDVYGHLAGDQVLRTMAQLIGENIRSRDVACRYGGDELTVILPDTDRAGAEAIGRRIDQAIRTYPFQAVKQSGPSESRRQELRLRVSIGVATFPDRAQSRAALIEAADRGCYRAKAQGGGVIADD